MGVLQDLENTILSAHTLYDLGCPSISIAILEDGKVSAHVIGNSSSGGNGDANTETVYQSCSISKAVTSIAVARLVDQGKLTYETKVVDRVSRSLLQSIVVSSATLSAFVDEITIGMLLSHTAGLSQHGFPGYPGDIPSAEDIILGRAPANTPKVVLKNIPGSRPDYCGAGFVLLQLFLEDLTGKSFPDIMHELVLEPLRMTRSWYSDLHAGEKNFAKAHYAAYAVTEGEYHRFPETAAAALWSTPMDMLKVVLAVQESLHSDSGFITSKTARKMLTKVAYNKEVGGMAMAWSVDEEKFGHSGGNDPGYCSYLYGFHRGLQDGDVDRLEGEAKGFNGIAVMLNCLYTNSVVIQKVMSAIYFLKGWNRYQNLPLLGDDDFPPFPAPSGTEIGDTWKEWIGKWDEDWEILDQAGPAIRFKGGVVFPLQAAAAPVQKSAGSRKEHILVIEGIRTGLRLTWKDNQQVVQLLNDEPQFLKRTK